MNKLLFLDAHTHLQLPAYDLDRDEVLSRAREAGVFMINVGTQETTSRLAIALAEHHNDMRATIGFHPSHCNENWHHDKDEQVSTEQEVFDREIFLEFAKHPKVVAIGECGLDYFDGGGREPISDKDRQKQKEVFLAQIQIAEVARKPLMIHCRDAFADLVAMLTANESALAPSRGIVHFFTGTVEDTEKLLKLGFSFTFGGAITFPPRKGQTVGSYDEVIKMIPIDRIMSETDAPYVAPLLYRGQRNEPAYVVEVVKRLAELKNVSVDEMAEQINKNAQRVLGI